MSGHALAARTLLAAADELVGGPPVEASAAALAGDAAGAWRITPVDGRRRGGRRGEQNGRDAVSPPREPDCRTPGTPSITSFSREKGAHH